MIGIVNILAEEIFEESALLVVDPFDDGAGLFDFDFMLLGIATAAHLERGGNEHAETPLTRQYGAGGPAHNYGPAVFGDDHQGLGELLVVTFGLDLSRGPGHGAESFFDPSDAFFIDAFQGLHVYSHVFGHVIEYFFIVAFPMHPLGKHFGDFLAAAADLAADGNVIHGGAVHEAGLALGILLLFARQFPFCYLLLDETAHVLAFGVGAGLLLFAGDALIEGPPDEFGCCVGRKLFGIADDIEILHVEGVFIEEALDELSLPLVGLADHGAGVFDTHIVTVGVALAADLEGGSDADAQAALAGEDVACGAADDDGAAVLGGEQQGLDQVLVISQLIDVALFVGHEQRQGVLDPTAGAFVDGFEQVGIDAEAVGHEVEDFFVVYAPVHQLSDNLADFLAVGAHFAAESDVVDLGTAGEAGAWAFHRSGGGGYTLFHKVGESFGLGECGMHSAISQYC